jgi:carbon monoxide dehydrogenase subunit G
VELKREQIIAADQRTVWNALNNDEILKASIPGCESVERTDANTLRAVVKIKVGPVGARFSGIVRFSDQDAPNGYKIAFEGQGGAAGFANGHARVELKPQSDTVTILSYEAHAQVGGKLAQIGARLIDSVAVKTSGEFFESFSRIVTNTADSMPADRAPAAAVAEPAPAVPPAPAAVPVAAPAPVTVPALVVAPAAEATSVVAAVAAAASAASAAAAAASAAAAAASAAAAAASAAAAAAVKPTVSTKAESLFKGSLYMTGACTVLVTILLWYVSKAPL